jgi:hypothetical protein
VDGLVCISATEVKDTHLLDIREASMKHFPPLPSQAGPDRPLPCRVSYQMAQLPLH